MMVKPQEWAINILTRWLSAEDHWCDSAGDSLSQQKNTVGRETTLFAPIKQMQYLEAYPTIKNLVCLCVLRIAQDPILRLGVHLAGVLLGAS